MNVGNILLAEDRTPRRHRSSSVQDRVPKKILVFENRILRQLRPHASHRACSMTGLAIVGEDVGTTLGDTNERADRRSWDAMKQFFAELFNRPS